MSSSLSGSTAAAATATAACSQPKQTLVAQEQAKSHMQQKSVKRSNGVVRTEAGIETIAQQERASNSAQPSSSRSNQDLTSLAAVALAASSSVATDHATMSSTSGPQHQLSVHAASALTSSGTEITQQPRHLQNGQVAAKSPRNRTTPATTNTTPPSATSSGSTAPAVNGNNNNTSSSSSSSKLLRRGKWTVEEETYVARVIQDFNLGYLKAPAGTTLRSYLSEKLQCDPMRITKKFTGDACIGKRVFHPAVPTNAATLAAMKQAQTELEELERQWRRRMELQQSESAKKAAASAAAVAAGCLPAEGTTLIRAASWLEKAKETLEATNHANGSTNSSVAARTSLTREDIIKQMNEVQKLLAEGPTTKSTSAIASARRSSGSAALVPSAASTAPSSTSSSPPMVATSASLDVSGAAVAVNQPHHSYPRDLRPAPSIHHQYHQSEAPSSSGTKRHRPDDPPANDTSQTREHHQEAGAEEDAQALVNFLQTVQAAASKGTTH